MITIPAPVFSHFLSSGPIEPGGGVGVGGGAIPPYVSKSNQGGGLT